MKKMSIRKISRTILAVFMTILFFWIVTGYDSDSCDPIKIDPEKPYVLAYFDQDWKMQIRWSEEGSSWQSANSAHSDIDRGPGLACDEYGVTYISVFCNSASKARYNMGLGPSEWDAASSPIGDGHSGEIKSASSVTALDGTKYLVAYLNNGKTKIRVFNTSNSVRDFEDVVTPVSGLTNDDVADRPAMIRLENNILAGWVLSSDKIELVNGNIASGMPDWGTGYTLNISESGYYAPESVIDLATDGERYYLATLRKGHPDGNELYPFSVFIYTSTNGLNWTKLTSFSTNYTVISALSIAASSQNDVIAIISLGATRNSYTKVKHFDGSSWSEIDEDEVFGSNTHMHGHDLTLFRRY